MAAFLAAALLWSGVGTIEAPLASAQPWQQPVAAFLGSAGSEQGPQGSVEDHHLDDLLIQLVNDAPLDLPGLLGATLTLSSAWRAPAPAPATPSVLQAPPCLAGPLRPPCSIPAQA